MVVVAVAVSKVVSRVANKAVSRVVSRVANRAASRVVNKAANKAVDSAGSLVRSMVIIIPSGSFFGSGF